MAGTNDVLQAASQASRWFEHVHMYRLFVQEGFEAAVGMVHPISLDPTTCTSICSGILLLRLVIIRDT